MSDRLNAVIDRFAGLRVLVVGEAMLDSYLEGDAGRLCREAPVPVVNVTRRTDAPGGAANTACNAGALGARVCFLSVIGDDPEGELLRRSLERNGVGAGALVVEPGRRTLAKHRVLAGDQMLVRFDQGNTGALCPETERKVARRLEREYARADAVIVSDYGYGVLGDRVLASLAKLRATHPAVLVADAKDLRRYRDVRPAAVKPNFEEACALVGVSRAERMRGAIDPEVAANLLDATGAAFVALTLDCDGTVVIERGAEPFRLPARRVEHASTAGAGDTFVAALALGLACEASPREATSLAAAAASVVVGEDGTAACSPFELREALADDRKYVADRQRLAERVDRYRRQGKRVVFTNGCFDILHSGHISYLNQARSVGDALIVGLNSDDSVRRLKGPERPVNTLDDRARVIAGLDSVTLVVPFDEDTPSEIIRIIRPDVFVKGGDYREDTLPEAPLVRALGGDVRLLPFVEDRSTSGLIARIRASAGAPPAPSRRERKANGRQPLAAGEPSPLR